MFCSRHLSTNHCNLLSTKLSLPKFPEDCPEAIIRADISDTASSETQRYIMYNSGYERKVARHSFELLGTFSGTLQSSNTTRRPHHSATQVCLLQSYWPTAQNELGCLHSHCTHDVTIQVHCTLSAEKYGWCLTACKCTSAECAHDWGLFPGSADHLDAGEPTKNSLENGIATTIAVGNDKHVAREQSSENTCCGRLMFRCNGYGCTDARMHLFHLLVQLWQLWPTLRQDNSVRARTSSLAWFQLLDLSLLST